MLICVFALVCGWWQPGASAQADAPQATFEPVTLREEDSAYVLQNRKVSLRVDRRNGDLLSLKYQGRELLGAGSGHPGGYWSHTPGRGSAVSATVTINPSANGGERAEVAIKGVFQGTPLGAGPGGSTACDIEIRYALGREDSGPYTYAIFSHHAGYPATQIGEARFAVKLNERIFDYLAIDEERHRIMPTPADWHQGTPLNLKEARRLTTGRYAGQVEHKYDYSAVQFDIPAFGWSGSTDRLGIWFVNPTIEYLSGGATKVELTGHLDVNEVAAPTLLNYWRGSHYGGSYCVIAPDEEWTRVIGPFQIYCNSGLGNEELWREALAHASQEATSWPYEWVQGVDYPHRAARGSLSGRLVLNDPRDQKRVLTNVLVGLAHPTYPVRTGRGSEESVDWQLDAKYYQFWVRAGADGSFTLPHVRAGSYTLTAIADGVLGEFTLPNVKVPAGREVPLGRLEWQPVRRGKQLWEIGTPDRTAREFRHGDHYWQWGLYNEYPREFPNDVNFIIGQSDWHKDWNYAQCPRPDRPGGTTWSIHFNLLETRPGKATLRLALAGASAREIKLSVNDHPAGSTGRLMDTATIRRDGIRGYWLEREIPFDAALLKVGTNTLSLAIPPGGVMNGVEYDYLRLEFEPRTGEAK